MVNGEMVCMVGGGNNTPYLVLVLIFFIDCLVLGTFHSAAGFPTSRPIFMGGTLAGNVLFF